MTAITKYRPQPAPPVAPYLQNADAEIAMLAGILNGVEPHQLDYIRSILPPEDVWFELARSIYEAVLDLHDARQSITPLTVKDRVRTRHPEILGHEIDAYLLQPADWTRPIHSARILSECALRRRLYAQCMETMENLRTGADAFDAVETYATQIMLEAERRVSAGGRTYRSMRELMPQVVTQIAEAAEISRAGGIPGLATGLCDLDVMTGGFRAAQLVILAARPAMGKSLLAATFAENAASLYGKSVGLFSLEMPGESIGTRMVAHGQGVEVSASNLRLGRLDDLDLADVRGAAERLAGLPIVIDDTAGLSIDDLRARARIMRQREKVDLIIVDYLQLLSAKAQSREQEISAISRGLKRIAKELGVPVIALSQLNRSVESRGEKRPMLSDLRESGSLEQDADVVMFVHRPEYYGIIVDEEGRSTEGVAEVIIGKQRDGKTGTVRLHFDGARQTFRSATDRALDEMEPPREW